MVNSKVSINGFEIDYYAINTLIVGSGTASLNAAISLHSLGQKDILIVTEKWGGGTSNNAGSDKQTYYKLSLAGDEPDSSVMMANDLYNGHCMHGDIALCEAQGSVQAFMNLVSLGVPFPQNRYGSWVGYKTDNDPRARATSAGPCTSRIMFEKLAEETVRRCIPVMDRVQVVALFTNGTGRTKRVTGALAIKTTEKDYKKAFLLINSVNTVLGTGGPAGIYDKSVYPPSQAGSSGIAFEAGATGQNLTESQFGLASVRFRWNLSGSYQQVIPRYVSTDQNGKDEKEFLNDSFADIKALTRAIFLKGYQWPFDPGRISNYGSSLIDLLVYLEENEKNRRVFLDYSRNPAGPGKRKFSTQILDKEVRRYLAYCDALGKTPYERLKSMNKPAAGLYLGHNIDLRKDYLEISVCIQHNNGGLKGNIWWESDLKHLFPVGEVNGSHGVYRPGGAALNSGQVGSRRAALFIAEKYSGSPPQFKEFLKMSQTQLNERLDLASAWLYGKGGTPLRSRFAEIRKRMSDAGGIIRDSKKAKMAAGEAAKMMKGIRENISAGNTRELAAGFRLLDHCLTHLLYLEAIREYLNKGGRSRGSFLVLRHSGKSDPVSADREWQFPLCSYDRNIEKGILEVAYRNGKIIKKLAEARPIPVQELWFEKVWKENMEDNLTGC